MVMEHPKSVSGLILLFVIFWNVNNTVLFGALGTPSDLMGSSTESPANLSEPAPSSSGMTDSNSSSNLSNSSFITGSLFVEESSGSTFSTGSTLDRLKDLLSSLLEGYDTKLRPRLNQAHTVVVNTSFALHSIVEFDTTGQRVGVMGYFIIMWRDDVLQWNPVDYDGTNFIKLPLNSIWYPSLVIGKTYDDSKVIGSVEIDRVSVSANGQVLWVPDGIFNFMCEVSVRYYPFDVQTCELSYYVSDETILSVFLNGPNEVQLQYFAENSEWRLLDASSTTKEMHKTNFVYLTFKVERRAAFTVYTMILPLVALALLNVFTFLVPIESGEKGGLAITLFLAYGFFITITRDALPHNSIQVSYYVVYITILLVLSVLTVIYVIVESKIYFSFGANPFRVCWRLKSNRVDENETVPVSGAKEKGTYPKKKFLEENKITWAGALGKVDTILFVSSSAFVALVSIVLWSVVMSRN